MAKSNDSNHRMEIPANPSPATPSPSIPLHLCGFLAGDTVQVDGDTGELQFSVQFNVRRKEHQSGEPFNFPDANIPEIGNFRDPVQSPPSSPYFTRTSTGENQDHNADANAVREESWSRGGVVTRLRSGVLSPVKYCYHGIYGVSDSLSSQKKKKSNKGRAKGDQVFEKMLTRRSFPLRPCNSYAFFLMKNLGVVKRSSFVETSKRLSKQWYKLRHDLKKEYEDMALKDYARYKRQCMLLRNDVEHPTTSGLLADSDWGYKT